MAMCAFQNARKECEVIMREKNLIENYKKYYNASASDLFSSSGRIELLGNHTDHNHGRVLVGAVNLDLLAAVAKTDDDTIIVYSEGYSETKVSLNDLTRNEEVQYIVDIMSQIFEGRIYQNFFEYLFSKLIQGHENQEIIGTTYIHDMYNTYRLKKTLH